MQICFCYNITIELVTIYLLIDKVEMTQKSGIYKIAYNHYDQIYIGQIKRFIETGYKEHAVDFRCERTESSTVTQHLIQNGHNIDQISRSY